MKFSTKLCSVLLLSLIPVTSFAGDLDQAAFNKAMDAYLKDDANVSKVGEALGRYIQKKQQEEAKAQQGAEKAAMENAFKNPTKIDIGTSPVKGNPNAKVTVIEFSDYECPYCKRGSDNMAALAKEYPNDVKIVFKNLPLGFHKQAEPAARAALAAGKQGKYWEMHDALFENQKELGMPKYLEIAKNLKLDIAKFEKDMTSAEVTKQIEDDKKLATSLGINGTPGYFVNGVPLKGAQPLPAFKELVDKWLAKL